MDTDWDSVVWHSSDPERMKRIMKAWEDHLADPRLPRTLGGHLATAGFEVMAVEAVPMMDSSWAPSGLRDLAEVVSAYVPGHAGVSESEAEAWSRDLDQLVARNEYFFCLTSFLFTARRR